MAQKIESRNTKIALALVSVAWLGAGAWLIFVNGFSPFTMVTAAGLVALAAGVWLRKPIARSISKLLLGI